MAAPSAGVVVMRRVLVQPGAQRLHLGPQLLKLSLIALGPRPERGNLGVFGLDHLPQPDVSRPQRGHLIRTGETPGTKHT